MSKFHYSAVILDMDGLVLDTESTYFIAWKYAVKQQSLALSDVFCASLSGCAFDILEKRLMRHLGGAFNFTEFCEVSRQFWHEYVAEHGISVKHGVLELLSYFNDCEIPYCLASNSMEHNVHLCLKAAGLEHVFKMIICADHVKTPKPAADLFLKAADALDYAIEECLVIEDSIVGLMAAKNAGANSILIPSILPINTDVYQYTSYIFDDLSLCQRYLAKVVA